MTTNIEASSQSPQHQSHLVRNTAIAAALGGGLNAGSSLILQKHMIKNSDSYVQINQELLKTAKPRQKKNIEAYLEVMKNKKISGKLVAKAAVVAAAWWAGIYLAYRGVKSLFKGDED